MTRGRSVVGWLPAILLVPAAATAGILTTVPRDDVAAMRAEQPLDLGTTWVYDVFDHGRPSGTRTSQVVRPVTFVGAGGAAVPVAELDRDYTDYPGFGGPRHFHAFLSVRGNTIYQYAQEQDDSWYPVDPPIVAYQLPATKGRSWSYKGHVGDIAYTSKTDLTEVVDVEVGGRTFQRCAHFVTTSPLQLDDDHTDDPDATETLEEWDCPGFGTVRSRDRVDTTGVDITEELTEFHGVGANWYAAGHEPKPPRDVQPVAGSMFGFDPGRSFAVPDGVLGRRLAWTDMRHETPLHPPVSDGTVMVLAERNGAVSLRTTGTGEMRWEVRLRGPILAAPVIAGDTVIVADGLKQVWALSRDDGRALWMRALPDVVSASPVVTGDQVTVPTDDGSLTAMALTDGTTRWQQHLGGAVHDAVAYDGQHLLAGDVSGTLTAVDPADGSVDWSSSLDAGLAEGPMVTEGRVLVVDGDGVLHAFSPDGGIDWQSRQRSVVDTPLVGANGTVVLVQQGDMTAYDTANGHQRWRLTMPNQTAKPAIVGDEVVVGLRSGEIRVYGLADGRLVDHWRLPTSEPGGSWSDDVEPALVGGDLVISAFGAGNTNAVLFAYPTTRDAARGVSFRIDQRVFLGTPVDPPALVGDDIVMASFDQLVRIGPDGSTTALAQTPGTTHAGAVVADGIAVTRDADGVKGVRLKDGTVLWTAPGGTPGPGSVPATDGTTVFYGVTDVGLAAADLRTGQLRWATPIPHQQATMTPLVLPDGDVIYGGGGVGRYDGATGEELWRDAGAVLFGPAAYADGVVYATTVSDSSQGARLTAYDATTGRTLWSHRVADVGPFLGPGVGSGVVVAMDGHVAHAYDATTGKGLWSLTMLRPPMGSPVITNGQVFLAQAGNGRDAEDDQYRITVNDPRTGRLLGAWQTQGTPLTGRPDVVGTPDGRLLVPDLGMTVLETVR